MIRSATISDSESIANALWGIWHQLKARQIGTPLHAYSSAGVLKEEIRRDLSRWFVCESPDPKQRGFFELSRLGGDNCYKRWRFPESAVRIECFACFLGGEVLLHQFQLLAVHLGQQSILLCIASPLRDAYWAALKAGFRLLGESPLIVGTIAWLYLDREGSHDEIQTKLRRAKVIVA